MPNMLPLIRQSFRDKETSRGSDIWVTREPLSEAYDLYRMVRYGTFTIASIRKLISVPPEIESALRAYAVAYPEDSGKIERVLGFRKKVAQEFERMLAPLGAAATTPRLLEGVGHDQEAA